MIELWQFLLSLLVSYLGIALGASLQRIAPEEHRPFLSLLSASTWRMLFGKWSALAFYLVMGILLGHSFVSPNIFPTLCSITIFYGMTLGFIQSKKKTLVADTQQLLFRNLWFFAAAFACYSFIAFF